MFGRCGESEGWERQKGKSKLKVDAMKVEMKVEDGEREESTDHKNDILEGKKLNNFIEF